MHDIPLLAENGRAGDFDAVIVVDAPPEVQVERMTRDRGWTREDAESRMRAQSSREDRLAVASYVVENTGTREDLRRRVAEVFAELRSRRRLGARSGSANLRSLAMASRSSWRTRSAEMPCRAPMSASLCCRPSTRP